MVFCVCITPLGSPVVPEVNTTSCTALGSVPGSPPRPARASQASSVSLARGRVPSGACPRATNTCSSLGSAGRSEASMPEWPKPRKAAGTTATCDSSSPSMNRTSRAR